MIRCRELVELVTAYLDDALPAHERETIERHLEECDGCRTFVHQFHATIALAGQAGQTLHKRRSS